MTSLEETLREAFTVAEKHRRAAGYGTRSISEVKTTRKDGTVWYGPGSYKWTGWFMPWDYLDVVKAIEVSDRPDQSMTKFIKGAIKEKCDRLLKHALSARPEPRLKAIKGGKTDVGPIRRRPRPEAAQENAVATRAAEKIMHREAHG